MIRAALMAVLSSLEVSQMRESRRIALMTNWALVCSGNVASITATFAHPSRLALIDAVGTATSNRAATSVNVISGINSQLVRASAHASGLAIGISTSNWY
jgi:hypothetical protein